MVEFNRAERYFTSTTNRGDISSLLKGSDAEVTERKVVLCRPSDFGVVIGSTQKISKTLEEYAADHSTEIHRRSSGGSAVIIDPASSIWIDIYLPPNDPLATTSIETTFEVASIGWTSLLSTFEIEANIYRGPYHINHDFKEVCFAGRAHGEVLVGEKKVVGMAQRRRRIGSYVHTMAYLAFPYEETLKATYGKAGDLDTQASLKIGSLSEFGQFNVDSAEKYLEIFAQALNREFA